MSKIIVGHDIRTTKIACFVGRKNEHDKIEILSMGTSESLGVMRGVVSNIQRTVQSIQTAVEQAENNIEGGGSLNIKVVNVGIAGQHIKSIHRCSCCRTRKYFNSILRSVIKGRRGGRNSNP